MRSFDAPADITFVVAEFYGNGRRTLHGLGDDITADVTCCSCARACSSTRPPHARSDEDDASREDEGQVDDGGCQRGSHEARWQALDDGKKISEGDAQRRPRCEDGRRCSPRCVGFGGWICPTPSDADDHRWRGVITGDGHARRAQCGFWCMEKPTASLWAHRCALGLQRSMPRWHGATGQRISIGAGVFLQCCGSGGYSDRSGPCRDAMGCSGQRDGHGQGDKIGHSRLHQPQWWSV